MSQLLENSTGFPIGNFGIAGEVSPDGRLLGRVMYNPPVLGPWLKELGRGRFIFSCDGASVADEEFETKRIDRLFPEASAEYADPRFPGLTVRVSFTAPIRVRDAFACSVPAICADIEFINAASKDREVSAGYEFVHDLPEPEVALAHAGGFWLVGGPKVKIGFDRAIVWKGITGGLSVAGSVLVPADGCARLRFMLVCHESSGYYAERCQTIDDLAAWVSAHWSELEGFRTELIDMLPRTHDAKVNEYLRWYLVAGVLLTRLTREHVLTMGYAELNQRDSFWTSWPHLVLWPDLERRMIEESADHQRENGKIPTTILPTIERDDDIDINCYFNLRIARYYEWTRDAEFLRQMWPAYRHSIDFLKSTDRDGDGLVDQGSFWADWKDVSGVEGRKAGPHFEFLWVAVLRYAKEFAGILDDCGALEEYSALYDRSMDVVNRPVSEGGLWNGRFYTNLWYDGREDNHCQQDQFAGPLYGVVPEERISSVYDSIDAGMADWGVRDTWPYRDGFSHVPGDYHNGGVWVFLNFADALSRFATGRPSMAWEILRRVGYWDLEEWGDYLPAEYLDGNTGANAGALIQGWNADFFGAVLFGALGVRVMESNNVEVMPRILDTESFDTPVALPGGMLYVKHVAGSGALTVELRSALTDALSVRYGAMTSKSAPGCSRERIGECDFAVVTLRLAPGETATICFA